MSIWNKPVSIQQLQQLCENTLVEHLDIKVTEIGDDYLEASMPVDQRTHQPMGILHGGASVALAETLGSIASNIIVPENQYAVGLDINANHIRSVSTGLVFARTTAIHLGRTTHVWEIKIKNSAEKLVCQSRLTMIILEKNR